MKKTAIFSLLFLFSTLAHNNLYANLTDGTPAPDWTLTDTDGVTHTLSDYLDAGMTVILDFSATWCGPCWSYHNSGALEQLYSDHGPNGDNTMMVFYIEGDINTSIADLNGTGSNTQGNWMTVSYPIINLTSSAVKNDYNVGAYPTLYMVCRDNAVYNIGQPTAAQIESYDAQVCPPQLVGTDNAILRTYDGQTAICDDFTPSVDLGNGGNAQLTSATITLSLDGNVTEGINWTGNLDSYDTETINFSTITLSSPTLMEFNVSIPNGNADDDTSNDTQSVNLTIAEESNSANLTLDITTDSYGCENKWEIFDESGTIIASGGNPNALAGAQQYGSGCGSAPTASYASNSNFTENISLPSSGCFTLRFYDDYGDGMCCSYGSGSFELSDATGTILASGGSFGSTIDIPFHYASDITLQAKAFLEGAMNGTNSMDNSLNNAGLVPLDQPFNAAPWNYSGTESLASIPSNMVDWALVELRSDLNTIVAEKAVLILDDGSLVDHDNLASGEIAFNIGPDNYFIVVRARGHLDVMSANAISLPNSSSYDFGSSATQSYGSNQLKLVDNTYALHAGDSNGDGVMTVSDFNAYLTNTSAVLAYEAWDFDLDGFVSVKDYNLYRVNMSVAGVNEIRYP